MATEETCSGKVHLVTWVQGGFHPWSCKCGYVWLDWSNVRTFRASYLVPA